MRGGWWLGVLLVGLAVLLVNSESVDATVLCSSCLPNDFACLGSCVNPCTSNNQCGGGSYCCYDSSAGGNICQAPLCAPGYFMSDTTCAPNSTYRMYCDGCGTTEVDCLCTPGTTTTNGCTSGYYKTCLGASGSSYWGSCTYDCRGVTCNNPPTCKLSPGTCGTGGCTYPTNAPAGDACGSSTFVCNGAGSCSMPRCTIGRCTSSLGNAYINTTAWCDGGLKCYQCNSGYVYDSASGTCITSTCSPNDAPFCEGNNLKTCTKQANDLYAWSTTACSGVCTVSPPPAQCCTPESQATTCGTNTCGTKLNNCGQSISCGTCTGGQVCTNTTPTTPGVCVTPCQNECTNGARQCSNNGVQTCGYYDNDACTEWSAAVSCAATQTCVGGECKSNCASPNFCAPALPKNGGSTESGYCANQEGCYSCPANKFYDRSTGSCVSTCTPACAKNTQQCSTSGVPQSCDAKTGCWVDQPSCTGATACLGGVCEGFTVQVKGYDTAIPPTSAMNESTVRLTLSLYPQPPADTQTVRYQNDEEFPFLSFSPVLITGRIGTVYTAYFRVYMYNRLITSTQHEITITCSPGEPCYCPTTTESGCVTGELGGATVLPGKYCPQGTCAQCPANLVFADGRCVPCTSENTLKCPLHRKYEFCETPTCTQNTCDATFKPVGTSCGDKLTCDANGKCAGCSRDEECQDTVVTFSNTTRTECKDTMRTFKRTTDAFCDLSKTPRQCDLKKTFTDVEIDKVVTDAPNGTYCGEGLSCFAGSCQPFACAAALQSYPDPRTAAESTINWTEVFSTCSGTASACGFNSSRGTDYLDADCDEGNGLCKYPNNDTCAAKCPTLYNGMGKTMPGCRAGALSNTYVTGDACPGSDLCFNCEGEYFYNGSACVLNSTEYTFRLSMTSPVAQSPIIITPVVEKDGTMLDNSDKRFLFTLTSPEGGTVQSLEGFTLRFNNPGDYPISVTAFETHNGVPFGSITRTLSVSCPLNNACCPASSNDYLPDGATCFQGGEQGTCHQKACVLGCIPSGAELCNNGKDDDCNGRTDCSDDACTSTCGGLVCKPGEIICDRACTDTMTSSTDCGSCGNRCGSKEQCLQGTCTFIEGCDVICNVDGECGRGMICINPGSCTTSYCAPANAVQLNSSQVESIMAQYAKTFTITEEIRGDTLHVTIRNLAPVTLHNFTLTLNIPKSIAQSASELGADTRFTIIEDDPVISFNFPRVNAKQDIAIDLPAAVDPAFVNSISASGTHNPLNGTPEILTEEITITSNLVKDGNRTKLLLGLQPHAELYGVRVPVEIPKCVALSAKRLQLSGDYEIIQDDPLVVWTFDSLTSKETIEISIEGDITEECKDQLTAFAVADTVDKPVNPWIPLLLIPVIGIIIFTFSRFHGGGAQERLAKKEFIRLAMEQGQTQEQAEQSWKEYDNKW